MTSLCCLVSLMMLWCMIVQGARRVNKCGRVIVLFARTLQLHKEARRVAPIVSASSSATQPAAASWFEFFSEGGHQCVPHGSGCAHGGIATALRSSSAGTQVELEFVAVVCGRGGSRASRAGPGSHGLGWWACANAHQRDTKSNGWMPQWTRGMLSAALQHVGGVDSSAVLTVV